MAMLFAWTRYHNFYPFITGFISKDKFDDGLFECIRKRIHLLLSYSYDVLLFMTISLQENQIYLVVKYVNYKIILCENHF